MALGGLKHFTQTLANELGVDGIRVNGTAPGLIRTQAPCGVEQRC
jgi:NAD(P)-dependent dehydrogenase (short-subunit alcohol dehydrogenase family)